MLTKFFTDLLLDGLYGQRVGDQMVHDDLAHLEEIRNSELR